MKRLREAALMIALLSGAFGLSATEAASGAASSTMKAVVARHYGGSEMLKLEEMPVPEPKESEVLVRVIAS
ncbi:MAG: hypothetical protein M3Z64_01080, partial [Verrucomicrobiota bacterium]|nr:hypothetical protein [Verrucomicrobiota bacterium]